MRLVLPGDLADWANAALAEVGLEPNAYEATLRSTGEGTLLVPGLTVDPLRHRAGMLAMLHAHGPSKTVRCREHAGSSTNKLACGRVTLGELLLDPDVRCCPLD